MKKVYYIRYNVEHKNGNSEFLWRVFESEDKFYLTKSVKVCTMTWTASTPFPEGGFKYSIYCEGTMTYCNQDEIVIE
jgi:hypothetical protein